MWLLLAGALTLAHPHAIDGDTLSADGERYRLAGIDAPEVGQGARCMDELVAGALAAQRVRDLLAGAAQVVATPQRDPAGPRRWPRDRYGRRLARVSVDGVDLGALLVGEGLAVAWDGTRHDWCGGRP